jgi:hypothetical protein
MQRNVGRLTLATSCALVCTVLVTAVAWAAATVTTNPATKITATTADLHGVIHTGGAAVSWQFEFTKTTKFITGRGTPVITIPKGKGTVMVTRTAVKLSPATRYRYRLVAITGGKRINGNVQTFTTKQTGRLVLDGTKLPVSGGLVSATFTCSSTLPCKSRYSITTHAKLAKTKTVATIVCATTKPFFTIPAHGRATVKASVRKACTALLSKSKTHTITGKLTSNPQTHQEAVIKIVTLHLV